MKYKVGDKVQIKSIGWYNENKSKRGFICFDPANFIPEMSLYCGEILTINQAVEERKQYFMSECAFVWTDEMIEGLVEEETKNNNDMEEKETLLGWVKESDSLRLVPHKDYEIKHDGDNFYLVKKKKEYPKTYEECCKVLHYVYGQGITMRGVTEEEEELFRILIVLKRCRDAYWKIYGEENDLGKPWEPDWLDDDTKKYIITSTKVFETFGGLGYINYILTFPTKEMRDAFKENFDPDIEFCKELL